LGAGGDNTIAALPRARPRARQRAIRLKRLRFLDPGSGKQEETGTHQVNRQRVQAQRRSNSGREAPPLYVHDTFAVEGHATIGRQSRKLDLKSPRAISIVPITSSKISPNWTIARPPFGDGNAGRDLPLFLAGDEPHCQRLFSRFSGTLSVMR